MPVDWERFAVYTPRGKKRLANDVEMLEYNVFQQRKRPESKKHEWFTDGIRYWHVNFRSNWRRSVDEAIAQRAPVEGPSGTFLLITCYSQAYNKQNRTVDRRLLVHKTYPVILNQCRHISAHLRLPTCKKAKHSSFQMIKSETLY